MRTSKFTPEQMVNILRQGDGGVPVVELCRQHGVSEQTFYRWKRRFGDLGTAEVRELRQLREENRKLKQVVADLTLDKQILKEALGKNVWSAPDCKHVGLPMDQTVCANVSGLSVERLSSGPRWKSACVRPH